MAKEKTTVEILVRALRVVASISTVYIAVVVTALFLQYRQLQQTPLLDFPEMDQLKQLVKTEKGDAQLKKRIRQLDLVARRNWFSGLEQLRIGGVLLAGGIVILLSSLGGARLLSGPPKPDFELTDTSPPPPGTVVLVLSAFSGLSVLAVMFLVLFLSSKNANIHNRDSREALSTDRPTGPSSMPAGVPEKDRVQKDFPTAAVLKNWPHFRGPLADGLALQGQPVLGWDTENGKGVKWKVAVPLPGFSSPLVWEDMVILTGGDQRQRSILAYHAQNGQLLWQADTDGIPGSPEKLPEVTSDTGFAAATPATNGRQVCAIFATGNLLCTDFNGKRLWAKNLGVPDNHYGHSSSLLMINDRLIVQFDDHERHILTCFHPGTGEVLWQTKRESAISWASPVYVQLQDAAFIILTTSQNVEAYHLQTGEQAWSTACLSGEVAVSPGVAKGRLFVANEFAQAAAIDAKSGALIWQTNEPYLPSVSSVLALEECIFLFSPTVSCLDAASGEILWEKDMPAEFYSSAIGFKDRIVVFDVTGTMFVLQPDREKMVITQQAALNEGVVATPAFAQGKMWVRGLKHLYCLESGAEGNERE